MNERRLGYSAIVPFLAIIIVFLCRVLLTPTVVFTLNLVLTFSLDFTLNTVLILNIIINIVISS